MTGGRTQKTYLDLDTATQRLISSLPRRQRDLLQGLEGKTTAELRGKIAEYLQVPDSSTGGAASSAATAQGDDDDSGEDETTPLTLEHVMAELRALKAENRQQMEENRQQRQRLESQEEVIERLEHERVVAEAAALPSEYGPDARFLFRYYVERWGAGISEETDRMALLRGAYFVAYAQCRDSALAAKAAEPAWLPRYSAVLDRFEAEGGRLLSLFAPAVAEVLALQKADKTGGGPKNRPWSSRRKADSEATSSGSAKGADSAVTAPKTAAKKKSAAPQAAASVSE